jgi:hypothetical protein
VPARLQRVIVRTGCHRRRPSAASPQRQHASGRAAFCRSRDRASRQVSRPIYDTRRWGSRFLQVDPVEGGSASDYDYVSGDPTNSFDLDGLCQESPTQRVRSLACTPSTWEEVVEQSRTRRRVARESAARARVRPSAPPRRCGRGEVMMYEAIGIIVVPKGASLSPPGSPTFGQQVCVIVNGGHMRPRNLA